MTEVTREYLDAHRHSLHTPESWARSVAEQVFNAAIPKLGTAQSAVEIDAKFTLSAYEPLTCIRLCTVIGGVEICYHVNT